jgi:hypothetical protein
MISFESYFQISRSTKPGIGPKIPLPFGMRTLMNITRHQYIGQKLSATISAVPAVVQE